MMIRINFFWPGIIKEINFLLSAWGHSLDPPCEERSSNNIKEQQIFLIILNLKNSEFSTIVIIEILWLCHTSQIDQSINGVFYRMVELFLHSLEQAFSLGNVIQGRKKEIVLLVYVKTIIRRLRGINHEDSRNLSTEIVYKNVFSSQDMLDFIIILVQICFPTKIFSSTIFHYDNMCFLVPCTI